MRRKRIAATEENRDMHKRQRLVDISVGTHPWATCTEHSKVRVSC